MRFLVVTEPNTPIPPDAVLGLYGAMKTWKASYTAAGKMEEIWAFANGKGGCGVVNVDSLEELNQMAAEYPFQPFSRMDIYALVDFDTSVDSATKAFGAMMAGMAHYIFTNNLQDQQFINRFCQGMDPGTMPGWAQGHESFKDYILGVSDGVPKTPEWAAAICGVKAEDIIKLADMYARTKPAALKASWAPGRNAYGEQYNRMAAALQAMTGNIGMLGGCAEGVGKAWHPEAVAYPYDQYSNVWYASIKSDRWAHIVLNYPNVTREEAGLWPRQDQLDGVIPNIRGIFWQGSDWLNQLTNINKQIKAIRKL